MRDPNPLVSGDVYPASEIREVYGKNAANWPEMYIDPNEVPPHLHEMIALVERWAIPCDVTRNDSINQQSVEDLADFFQTAAPYMNATRVITGEY